MCAATKSERIVVRSDVRAACLGSRDGKNLKNWHPINGMLRQDSEVVLTVHHVFYRRGIIFGQIDHTCFRLSKGVAAYTFEKT